MILQAHIEADLDQGPAGYHVFLHDGWPMSTVWFVWTYPMRTSNYEDWILKALKGEDFTFGDGGRCQFHGDWQGKVSLAEGFCIGHAPQAAPFLMPLSYFFAGLEVFWTAVMALEDMAPELFLKPLLRRQIQSQITARRSQYAHQELTPTSAHELPHGLGKYLRRWEQPCHLSWPYYPSMEPTHLFEWMWIWSVCLVKGRYFHPSYGHTHPRSAIFECMRLGRFLWEPVPLDFFDPEMNSGSPMVQMVDGYTQLCAYTANPVRKEFPEAVHQVPPFGIDWFYSLAAHLPDLDDMVEFSVHCERRWWASPPSVPGRLEIGILGFVVRLEADWVDRERLGWVDLVMVEDVDEVEDWLSEVWTERQ